MSSVIPPSTASELTYSVRPSIFVPERAYRLGADSMLWDDGRKKGSIAYADVTGVRIYGVLSDFWTDQRRCVLRSRDGRKTVLQATHYLGFGSVEDRSASYTPFAREVVARVAAANPQAVFVSGQYWAMWLLWLVIFIGILIVLAGAVAVGLRGEMPLKALPVFGIVIAFVPTVLRNLRAGLPHRFDPRSHPDWPRTDRSLQ